ncbi:DUF4190 domain-containing protein [Smaragdicoccus niigatensis]|uniref:DUF4190 domain-containing protein n=1 Tax=Smaragdicoccus niigatensis TaxID=359359 RepID=UPI0012DF696E|nr:DUF4190 domain-containing protein [Smaragdicoccus niigatensis]
MTNELPATRIPRQKAWICKRCGEKLSSTFDACWNCGTDRSGAKAGVDFRAGKTRSPVAEHAPGRSPVIGYTLDHEPIYQIAGITAAGEVVTLDRVDEWVTGPGQNQVAIAAFGFALVFPPVGIVLGHLARAEIRDSGEQGDGLALFALIWSYLALILFVVGLLLLSMSLDSLTGNP